MARFFGGTQPTTTPDYTGLQIQTAVNTLPVPIIWGRSKLAPNVIWYNNFQVHGNGGKSGAGKGGLFSSSSQTTYTAAVIMALCEGPIAGINQIWKNQAVFSLAQLGLLFFTGTTPQTEWAYIAATYPSQALAYQGTAYVASFDYSLGSAATLDNHNFEVLGFFAGTGVNGLDADPAQVVNDFLTNPQCGVGFPAGSIDTATLFGAGGDASYQTYCKAIGLCFSPVLNNQEQASSILDRWLKLTNTAAVWSGGQLRFIPYGDSPTAAGSVVSSTQLREIGQTPSGGINPPAIVVANATYFVADKGVTYATTGVPLAFIGAQRPTHAGTYGMTPAGTYYFANGDQGTDVEISYQYEVAASYVPDVTPIYNLGDDDFKYDKNQDPLQVSRTDPFEAYNVFRLETADRDNAYNLTIVEARDQSAIEILSLGAGGVGTFQGMRIASTVTAHELCDPNVALISAQLMVQRSVYIRNTYKFSLSWEYCLLDPMDLVTVTDELLGLNNQPVRITDIEEDENGFLQVTAEEFPLGSATATLYATQPVSNNPLNRNVDPGDINPPLIFEPTDELAGELAVWIAVSGQSDLWGGCAVYASTSADGNYLPIGNIAGPARMGVLSGDLPAVTPNPTGAQTIDQANILSVDLTESGGVLASGTDQDAVALNNIAYVGGEVLSYATATLTAADKYNLAYLVRGAFGTETDIVDHPAGTQFAMLDGAIFKFPYAQNRIGSTIYLKFPSFNFWDGGAQSLADVPAYPFVLTGVALTSPLPNVANFRSVYDANIGFTVLTWDPTDDFRDPSVEIRMGTSVDDAVTLTSSATQPFRVPGNGTFWAAFVAQPVAGLTVESESWSSVTIAGAVITQNVIATFDLKALNWPGVFTGGAGVDSVLNAIRSGAGNILTDSSILTTADVLDYGGSQSGAYYPGSNAFIDIGYVANASISMQYQPTGVPVGQNILAIADVLGTADILGSASTRFITVTPLIRFSSTPGGDLYTLGDLYNPAYADLYLETEVAWGAFQSFSPGTYQARFINFAMDLSTVDPATIAYDLAWVITITIPARIDTYPLTTSSSADTTVTFGQAGVTSTAPLTGVAPFNGGPGPSNLPAVQWGIVNAQQGDDLIITALSLSAISFKILNGGSRVVRSLSLEVEGF